MSEPVGAGPAGMTWIVVVLDRSGSMAALRDDAIGGFNAFVEEQRAHPGAALLSLCQFDDVYEVVFDARPLVEVPVLTRERFVPRGSTALHDAIGRTVVDLEGRLQRTSPAERPARVIVLIITDGAENASQTFDADDVAALVDVHQRQHGWTFLFFGCHTAVVQSASLELGMDPSATMVFRADGPGLRRAFATASDLTLHHRTLFSMAVRDLQGEEDPKKRMN